MVNSSKSMRVELNRYACSRQAESMDQRDSGLADLTLSFV